MKNNYYVNVVLPVLAETKFVNRSNDSFINPSKNLDAIMESVARHFPSGISQLLVPAMTNDQIKSLSYVELSALSLRANYLLSSGYWMFLHYSEDYLRKIFTEKSNRYEQVIRDGYRVLDNNGSIIAYYGYLNGKYKLIEVDAN